MEIKAVKFRKDGFYSQALAFGGEEGPDILTQPFIILLAVYSIFCSTC